MQPQLKNDLLYLLRILEAAETIKLYTAGFDEPVAFFEANHGKEFNASLMLLTQIGEQSGKISSHLKEKYPDFNWQEMKSFRNRAVHDYTGIDRFITFEIIKMKVPLLKDSVSLIPARELKAQNFDPEEFAISRTTPYLSHIDFDFITACRNAI